MKQQAEKTRRENDEESGKTARTGWHDGRCENWREKGRRDRKRQAPKGGRRLAPHSPPYKNVSRCGGGVCRPPIPHFGLLFVFFLSLAVKFFLYAILYARALRAGPQGARCDSVFRASPTSLMEMRALFFALEAEVSVSHVGAGTATCGTPSNSLYSLQ